MQKRETCAKGVKRKREMVWEMSSLGRVRLYAHKQTYTWVYRFGKIVMTRESDYNNCDFDEIAH